MSNEMWTDLVAHAEAIAKVSAELEEIAARVAWLCRDVADIKASLRTTPPADTIHLVYVDEANIN
jgi:hypothetical protein